MKSPLISMGGKFLQRKQIVALFPPHDTYVEVFGGAGHVIFAKPPSKVEVYNDINQELVNFFMVARDHREELMEKLDSLPYSRALHHQWKSEPLPENDNVERACRWFYILRSSFGGTYGAGWAYSKKRNIAQGFRSSISNISHIKDRFKNVLIDCLDFRQIIPKYDSSETLFYLDPPYDGQLNNEDYYGKSCNKVGIFDKQDHIDLALTLNEIKGKIVLSYGRTPLIQELYPKDKWVWFEYQKFITSQKKKEERRQAMNECYILNFDPNRGLL